VPKRPPAPSTDELLRLFTQQGEDFALVMLSPDGIVLDWLAGATRIFGLTAEEMIGQSIERIFTPEDLARGVMQQELEIARSVGRAEDDRWQLRNDGTAFWASGVVIPLRDEAGKLVGYGKMLRNRTDLKTQTEALENRVKALSEAEEQRNAFFGVVAHELRNPLSPLVSAVELIRRSGHTESVVQAGLQIIERQVAAIRRLVDDLMEMVRVGAGKMELDREVIELKEVVNAAANAARPLAEARDQHFQVLLLQGAIPVMGDPSRLDQVFANLLNNAIKYTPVNGRIWFKVTVEGGDAVVRVEDTGVGIDAEMMPKLFDFFAQEASSRAMASGGLGLGLPLVRELVTLHGGTVQARSDGRDKGSVFTVRLPMHQAPQP
jgi:two-component system CheB/CheR fusion protein